MRLIRNFCLALPALVAAYGLSLPVAPPAQAETATYAMYGDVKDWDPLDRFLARGDDAGQRLRTPALVQPTG